MIAILGYKQISQNFGQISSGHTKTGVYKAHNLAFM